MDPQDFTKEYRQKKQIVYEVKTNIIGGLQDSETKVQFDLWRRTLYLIEMTGPNV